VASDGLACSLCLCLCIPLNPSAPTLNVFKTSMCPKIRESDERMDHVMGRTVIRLLQNIPKQRMSAEAAVEVLRALYCHLYKISPIPLEGEEMNGGGRMSMGVAEEKAVM
jgi:hypothetical protein